MSPLMFSKQDVEAAAHPLVRLLRLIFFRFGITLDKFTALYADHGRRMREDPAVTSQNRNNTRRSLEAGRNQNNMQLTWKLFYFITTSILRLEIEEIRVVIRDPSTGKQIEIGSNDPVDR